MKTKILNALCLITSLIVYLEWGSDQSSFLFQMELEILSKLFSDPVSVIHPFIILPLLGQLLLSYTLFQKTPGKWITLFGILSLAILIVLIFAIGIMGLNFKIIGFSIPFLLIGGWNLWQQFGKSKLLSQQLK